MIVFRLRFFRVLTCMMMRIIEEMAENVILCLCIWGSCEKYQHRLSNAKVIMAYHLGSYNVRTNDLGPCLDSRQGLEDQHRC